MEWTQQRVIVTGAGGFIGSHLAQRLVGLGAAVTAVVRYNSRGDEGNLRYLDPEVRRRLDVRRIELTDIDAVRQLVQGGEVVFHLAALVGIPYSYANPGDVIVNNVGSTLNLLLVGRERGLARFLQTSTSEVYGSAQQVPIPETHPLQPQSPYSASKIATDNIALSFHYTYGLPVTIVRPFNTFGPRQSARAVLPAVICQALAGDEIRVGETTTTRDFTYVDDTVRGFLLLAATPDAVGECVNIGTGREVAVGDAIRTIVDVVGKENRVVRDEARVRPEASEVQRLCADISKARRLVGYEPSVSFEDGIRRTVDWVAAHLDVYRPASYAV